MRVKKWIKSISVPDPVFRPQRTREQNRCTDEGAAEAYAENRASAPSIGAHREPYRSDDHGHCGKNEDAACAVFGERFASNHHRQKHAGSAV